MMNNITLKRISILMLLILLAVSLFTVTSLASTKEPVMDYVGIFNDEDIENLNEYAAQVGNHYGLDVAILFTDNEYAEDQSLDEYARECYFAHRNLSDDGILLAIDSETNSWELILFGDGERRISEADKFEIFEAYNEATTYFDGVVDYYQEIQAILSVDPAGGPTILVRDYVGIFTPEEHQELLGRLEEVSNKHDFDVVALVVPGLNGIPAHEYAADYFETHGYGRGENNGCILLVAPEDRDFGFATLGYGNTVFTSEGQAYFAGYYLPFLREDKFFEAFMSYADGADDFLKAAAAGTPYDVGNIPGQEAVEQEEAKPKRGLFGTISLIISAIAAKFTTSRWKGQLKSVRQQSSARSYVSKDSLNLTNKKDVFLYRNLNRIVIPKREESAKGKTFTTSSGSKASGHSGKF